MTITEIRIELDKRNGKTGGLVGTVEITFDHQLVVKEIKIIRDAANHDLYFLEFPGRPFVDQCRRCSKPNGLSFTYCSRCGSKLAPKPDRWVRVAHPTDAAFRAYCTDAVLEAYAIKINAPRRVPC